MTSIYLVSHLLAVKLWWLPIEYQYNSAPYQPKIEDSHPSYKTQSSNY